MAGPEDQDRAGTKPPGEQGGKAEHGIYYAPWEKAFDRVLTPFEEFIRRQSTGGLLLMAAGAVALVLANSGLAEAYVRMLEIPLGIGFGDWRLEKTLHHWVNDGLMALFFFLVGLELKREILVGELAEPRQAALPIVAALGGMIVPALIYVAFNAGTAGARGWGVPMATDIAFAIGALVLLGTRVPKALITFLVALAIVDDLGAVIVIALFYTDGLVLGAVWAGLGLLALLVAFNLGGIRSVPPYFVIGVLLWYALLKSGVHATLAGVLVAFTIPARPKYDPARFSVQVKALLARFDASLRAGGNVLTNIDLRAILQTLRNGIDRVETPLQRMEHFWQLPVAAAVVPIFALFNAGVPLELDTLGPTLTHPVFSGIVLGLVLGKFVGITGACWLALKFGLGTLPSGTRFSQIAAVSLLAGIGFTMAIFIAQLAFAGRPDLLRIAKTGVLAASLLAGGIGVAWLWWLGRRSAS